jgi:soluble lytic murein transglycosylase-like protein
MISGGSVKAGTKKPTTSIHSATVAAVILAVFLPLSSVHYAQDVINQDDLLRVVQHETNANGQTRRETREESEYWARYYARNFGVPVELVEAIIEQESSWNPRARSAKGAAGLMQLMPQTAAKFRVRNRFRPQENIRGGVAYLALLSREFNGNVRLVTAAYYAGDSQVRVRRLEDCSPDVRTYVRKILENYRARRQHGMRPAGG